jgi:hypothetical protein
MSTVRNPAVPKLRWAVVAISIYFAACWMVLADDHPYWGAFSVFGVALVVGAGVLRSLGPLLRSEPGPARLQPEVPPQISMQDAIDAHSAEPEEPEHQRARFLGALGHELRNPLNSVTGFSDMLLGRVDGELNAEQERSVRTIRASAERLLRLVSTVVDRAKLEAGTLRLQQQWVVPDELISEAISFVRSRAEDTSVIGGVSEGLPRIFVDRHRTVHSLVSLAVLVIRSSGTAGWQGLRAVRSDGDPQGFLGRHAGRRGKAREAAIALGCAWVGGCGGTQRDRSTGRAHLDRSRNGRESSCLHDAPDVGALALLRLQRVEDGLVGRVAFPPEVSLQLLGHFLR